MTYTVSGDFSTNQPNNHKPTLQTTTPLLYNACHTIDLSHCSRIARRTYSTVHSHNKEHVLTSPVPDFRTSQHSALRSRQARTSITPIEKANRVNTKHITKPQVNGHKKSIPRQRERCDQTIAYKISIVCCIFLPLMAAVNNRKRTTAVGIMAR